MLTGVVPVWLEDSRSSAITPVLNRRFVVGIDRRNRESSDALAYR